MCEQLRAMEERFLFSLSSEGVSRIYTLSTTYQMESAYAEVVSGWEAKQGIEYGTCVYEAHKQRAIGRRQG